jgi:hypothetical protein
MDARYSFDDCGLAVGYVPNGTCTAVTLIPNVSGQTSISHLDLLSPAYLSKGVYYSI